MGIPFCSSASRVYMVPMEGTEGKILLRRDLVVTWNSSLAALVTDWTRFLFTTYAPRGSRHRLRPLSHQLEHFQTSDQCEIFRVAEIGPPESVQPLSSPHY